MRVGVVGATGYAGAELVRLLLGHPSAELAVVASRGAAGRRLDAVHPGLLGCTELVFQAPAPSALAELDAVFLAVPHGTATALAGALDQADAPLVIDLSADHRHAPGWVYGQVEWHGPQLIGATRIAVPGCFATCIELALAPFVASGRLHGPARVVAATGSTGSGATATGATHHPERFVNMLAYKVLRHQHAPEVTRFLRGLGAFDALHFVPLSAPVDRGILATCFLQLDGGDPQDTDLLTDFLAAQYAEDPAVHVRAGSPELRHVRGTARCHLSVHADGAEVVVLSAIDNLGKGAAGQALQCLNLACGLPVDTGLRAPALLP